MEKAIKMSLTDIRFNSYKSFDNDGPFNIQMGQNILLIIGKNNSGKSSLINVIEECIRSRSIKDVPDDMKEVCPSFTLEEERIARFFSKKIINQETRDYDFNYAYRFINHEFTVQLDWNGYIPAEKQKDYYIEPQKTYKHYSYYSNWENLAKSYEEDIDFLRFRRINAERDIVPEQEKDDETVTENGSGATNLIRKYINNDSKDESIVEKTILTELNRIMEPDAHFESIRVQQTSKTSGKTYNWEIFLEESGHRYAMSKMGSGLKTILLILINLYLMPDTKNYKDREVIYAFEEIENNLHPALQRRVFDYLFNYAMDKNIKIIITTHSHIAINVFFGKTNAKLYHVIKEDGHSKLLEVDNGNKKGIILDDLDVKASDLFQTNGIIWVEGPSDRVYILHWLQIFHDFQYKEDMHFQFMYYGGRLLAHYEASEQEKQTTGLINVLTINRHAAIVMDSDITSKNKEINDTKKRVQEEFDKRGLFCWVTQGKEIENYIPFEAVNATYKCNLSQIKRYQKFPQYINNVDPYFISNKIDAARKMCHNITVENSITIMDLKKKIDELYKTIKMWNE